MPSAFIEARSITKRIGTRTVLDGVDLRVDATSRIGLVGPNGSGKSTLLRILAGVDRADCGELRLQGTVGYLPQLASLESDARVGEAILERIGVEPAARQLDRFTARLEAGDLSVLEAHAAALERWVGLGGADAEARLNSAVAELGFDPALLRRPLRTLSGGQASRAGLAALAAARCDVVLLDEPSNHLDREGLELLRAMLAARLGGFVVVSHDRALLAEVTDRLVELDLQTATATTFGGGWDAYEAERAAARNREREEYERAVAARAKLPASGRELRRRAASRVSRLTRNPRDHDKHVAEWVSARADGMSSRARKIGTRALRIEVPDKPREEARLKLSLSAAERRSGALVALEAATIRRGAFVLGPLDFAVERGERWLLRGANASGKSSLLAALDGELGLAGGARHVATSARFGMLGQHRDALASDRSLVAAVRALTGQGEAEARTSLAGFGLGAGAAERPAVTLSPGERTRAELRCARCPADQLPVARRAD